jgi:hypothetical protein
MEILTNNIFEKIVPVLFAFYVLIKGYKLLAESDRNGWDILFLNSALSIIVLFSIGLIVNELEVWKLIIGLLGAVAIGERLISALGQKESLKDLGNFISKIENSRVHYILLSISFFILVVSLLVDRYIVPSFYFLIYSVGVSHMQLLRRQEWLDNLKGKWRTFFSHSIFIFFIIWSLLWVIISWVYLA